MGRAPCCDKENVKRGPWSPEEDAKLKGFIDKYGTGGNWIALPHKAGLKRCGKSCRLRWLNYLRPNIKHGEFTDDEDKIICSLYASIGSRWSIIAGQLPGRTDNDIKNYWNTKLKKKLLAMLPSFQKKPSFFPSISLQSPPPPPNRLSNHFLTTNSSPLFSSYNTAPNFMNHHNINSLLTTAATTTPLVQDYINITNLSPPPPPPPDSNSLINLITDNIDNNNENCFYFGFQEDHESMYNSSMLMFGNGGGDHGHEVMSATASSSEGGSCMSQISYGDHGYANKDHNIQKQQHHYQIKQEDNNRFGLQGFGDQTQSFFINHNLHITDQKPKVNHNYELSRLHSDVEEVKQLMIGNDTNSNRSSYWFNHDDDEYKTTQDLDNKEIRYHHY